jgi:glycosyltransferase involved in cell wall biosynthesis
MKILYIITQADGGGAQKYTLTLAKHFNGAIAAGNEAGKLFTDAERAGLKTFQLKHLKRNISPWHDILAVWEIRELIKSYRPDIVHLNSSKAGILGSFAGIGTKAKIIFTAHGFVFNEPLSIPIKTFYLALEKIASDYRDFIITVSGADEKSALDSKIIKPTKIATIHNGIAEINFLDKHQARASLGLPDGKIIIGCVANFYKTKGLDVLINALAKLDAGTKEKIVCAIIGEGPERQALESQIKDLGLQNMAKLLGSRTEIPAAIKAFDIFVLASRKEGLPYTILEAMQAGLPIVATAVGGIPEALADAGILVSPENPEELAGTITSLLANADKQKNLSQKALERSKLFTEQKMLDETEKIYKQVINKTI